MCSCKRRSPLLVGAGFVGWLATLMLDLACTVSAADELPPLAREFRAAWVATVANIDWPSQRGLSSQQQQDELLALLDRAAELNLNAIIFQVRPHCDALYASDLEPWSEYLTGTMGKPPEPFYDPLALAIAAAHERGLELHAWFNPYRASHPSVRSELPANHVSRTKPHAVREYGRYLWLDPGEREAADHSLAVILDVVRRYDVDGVHFDDYFYPYPVRDGDGQPIDFPDDPSWRQAQAAGNSLARADWRRQNVDDFIRRVYRGIRAEKPGVKFGISPFGIWRPGHPETITGFDAYANLYADARKWFREGDLDYLTPQLYWKIDSAGQSYPLLLRWWQAQNQQHRHLWPGNFTSRVGNAQSGNWSAAEIVNQIRLTREQEGASGNVHFSMKALIPESQLATALSQGPYREPALVPSSPWLAGQAPPRPRAVRNGPILQLTDNAAPPPWLWAVQAESAAGWTTSVLPGHLQQLEIDSLGPRPARVAVSAVNRIGMASPAQSIDLQDR